MDGGIQASETKHLRTQKTKVVNVIEAVVEEQVVNEEQKGVRKGEGEARRMGDA